MMSTVEATGLTCAHCVASIREEAELISGVTDVSVELVPGGVSTVSVSSDGTVEPAALEAAIREAGYTPVQST